MDDMRKFMGYSESLNTVGDIPNLQWNVFQEDVVKIKDINDEVFTGLEGKYSFLVKDRVSKRVLDETGVFILKEDGSFALERYPIPAGSACIRSSISLPIPYKYEYEKGYGFVDASLNKERPGFLYVVPKICLWKVPLVGLALSRRKMDSYRSIRVDLEGYGKVYLNYFPYKVGKLYRATRVLSTSFDVSYSFNVEIFQQLEMWRSMGLIKSVEEVEANLYEVDSEMKNLGGTDYNEETLKKFI